MKPLHRLMLMLAAGLLLGILLCRQLAQPPGTAWPAPTTRQPAAGPPPRPSAAHARPTPPLALPQAPQQAREFRQPPGGDPEAWRALETAFWATSDAGERLQLLDRMEAEHYTANLLPLVRALLAGNHEASLRERAIDLLAGNVAPEILAALQPARDDADPGLRSQALLAAAQVRDSRLAAWIAPALADPSDEVRQTALDAVETQTDAIRHAVQQEALRSEHADVALRALGELQVESSHAAVDLMLRALNAPLPEVREEARLALEFLLDQDFSGTDPAAWWAANRRRYAADLTEIPDIAPNKKH